MSSIRVLVGTRKGAFVLTSDGKRERWDVSGPHFAGWEIYHLKGSPADPNRLYASQSQRLVRAGDPALERRRQDVGAGRQQVRLRRRARHASVVRRHAASLGVQARLASRTVADRSRHGLRRSRGRGALPLDRRRADLAGAAGTARSRLGPVMAARRGWACACTRSFSIRATPSGCSSPSRPRARSGPTTAAKTWRPINRGLQVRRTFPTRMPRSATASTASRCTRRARACCSCRSTGTSCAATMPAIRGTRSAETCRPISASRSTFTRTSRRPSTSCRSRATRSTIRPTESCACTAAGRAGTSGRR